MDTQIPAPTVKIAGKRGVKARHDFVLKSENPNGTRTWKHPETMEEITLHEATAPTAETLANLAANGIVPEVPRFDELGDPLPEPDDDDSEDNALSRVLTRVKSTADPTLRSEVKIYKEKTDKTGETYCGVFTIEEFDERGEELVRSYFGPGKFRIRVYGPSMKEGSQYGKFVRLTNELLEIEPSLQPIKPANGADPNSVMIPALTAIMNRLEKVERGGGMAGGGDPWEQLARMAAVMRQLGIGGGKEKSLLEQIKELEALKDFKDNLSGGSSEKGDESLMSMFGKVLDVVKSQPAAQPALPAPMLAVPPMFQQNETQHQPMENENVNIAETAMLNVLVGALIEAAKRGDDIEKHAPGLADKMPDEVLDMLELPLWFDMLVSSVPTKKAELVQHQAWFTALRDRIFVLLAEPGPDA